ncbi:unnamed protein product [Rhodiola kirilowii]
MELNVTFCHSKRKNLIVKIGKMVIREGSASLDIWGVPIRLGDC